MEISCYLVGAGAFGVFLRWMQIQLAFNEEGLVDASAFNFLLPIYVVAAAIVFYRFTERMRVQRVFVPSGFCDALRNDTKLYSILRWFFGAIIMLGSLLLLADAETDKNSGLLRILAIFGLLAGVSCPLMLTAANKPHVTKASGASFLASVPIIFFGFWLIVVYKQNSINSVLWEFGVELFTIIFNIFAFFRVAGFAFGVPDGGKAMFMCMLAGMMDITSLADKRYMSMQIIFAGCALMLALYNWIMLSNLRQMNPEPEAPSEDGFEHFDRY